MKKRRYCDFSGRSSTNDGETTEGYRRSYSGRVSGSDQTEREYFEDDVGSDRQPLKPSQTHLSGGLRQCESMSMKFQWNNLLAQNPNPASNPRKVPGLNRPDLDYSNRSGSYRLDYEMGYGGRVLGVDQRKQYGHFDHRGFTSPLPKSHLGLQENEEDHRPIPYATLEDEPNFTSGTGYSSMEGFRGVRDEYDRSRAMAGLPIGHPPRQNELVDYGGSSIALSEGFRGEFIRSREMGHGGYSLVQTARHDELVDNAGGASEALNEGFRGRSRAMAEGPGPIGHGGYSHGQTPRKNELVHPRWAQQSPKEEMGRDYKVPGMKRNDNGDMDALFLLDLLYKKMATVGEDSRPPSHLTPSVVDSVVYRVGGSNGSVGAGTHENCQLDQYHDYMEPTNVFPNHQSTSEPSIPCYDEVLGSSNSRTEVCRNNGTQGFRLGVDVGHEREVEPLSYEGNLERLVLPDEDQGLLEAYGGCQQRLAAAESLASMTPLGRWALRKVAMKEQQSGNHSKSKFFPDLNPSCNVQNSSYEVDMQLTTTEDMQQQYANEDIQQYAATCGEDHWNMEQNVICGDGQWNIDQGVTRAVDQRNTEQGSIDQGVTCGVDQRNIAQGVTSGEDQCNIHRGVISVGDQWNNDQGLTTYGEQQWCMDNGGEQWNNDQGVTTSGEQQWRMNYGEDQWNAEHINNLNSDSLLPNSELPASTQEHYGEQSKSARIHVKERLGPPKLSTGNIKTRSRPPMKSPGSVKMRLGPSANDPNINILGFKPREQYKSRIRKTDDFSGSIHPEGDGIPKAKTDAAAGSIHPQGSALPQVKTDGFIGSIHPQGGGHSIVKTDATGSIYPQGNGIPNVKEGDFNGSIRPQGGSLSKVDVRAAKKEPPEDSKEFKQLVDDAFIKFINILKENPPQRRKIMEGKGGKCCVCASNSKEFVETATLARHAFLSPKVGFKAEHLGFHKALCVLLGWDSTAVSNTRWVQQNLPDAESLALKEDLVIWPPVVVIHNSSVADKNPEDERLTVNVEVLEAILTSIGFVGKKTMYCGKPADGSVMVVKFQPTFSGLQEAERLHKLFADNKHGKAEWRYINSVGLSNSSNGKQDLEADEANCLYGYLGNADDWDELDLGTKKHFGVKSKKQIKAIANASL
ncbi:putative XS domain-containing protein [Rosa chinensis]|uniref:Putative XS domain-containing protein n=1 Tax=Rosa chinensis TaxID=74649 RepID=A0A2P6QGB5_ROSCH|nr:putative XS domain-containing protein [Rosa chinensis]